MISLDVFTDICRERYKLHLRCLTGFEIRFCYQKYYFLQSIFKNKTNYFLQPLPVYLLKHKSILNLSDCFERGQKIFENIGHHAWSKRQYLGFLFFIYITPKTFKLVESLKIIQVQVQFYWQTQVIYISLPNILYFSQKQS